MVIESNGFGKEGAIGINVHRWYCGFRLNIIVNAYLEIVSTAITDTNVHDIQVLKNGCFIKDVNGILVGDAGYQAKQSLKKKAL
jgi:SRSO17 transposase